MYGIKDTDLTVLLNAEFTTTGIDGFRLISRHTRSVWATIYDSLPHSSYKDFWFKNPWVPPLKYFRNVGLEYLSPPPPPPMKIWSTWHLGFELVSSKPPTHPPLSKDLCCGSWCVETNRCFLKDTVSFIRYDSDCDRHWHNHYVTLRSVGVYVVQHWQQECVPVGCVPSATVAVC